MIVLSAGETAKLLATCAAAANVALPGWDAVIEQVPAETSVSTPSSVTVQTDGELDVYATDRPDEAVAPKDGGALPN